MADKVRININLGVNKHPMFVDRQEEPIYRDAAKLVNERLAWYAERFRNSNLPQEYLMGFAALDIAARYVRLHSSADIEATESDLVALVAELKQYVGNMPEL